MPGSPGSPATSEETVMDSLTENELIARHLIRERTSPVRVVPRRSRRTRIARSLRRAADRLDA
jgi:hypothetical protein